MLPITGTRSSTKAIVTLAISQSLVGGSSVCAQAKLTANVTAQIQTACINPASVGNSPVCESETSCLQSLVPWFDQQLNLGKDSKPSAAADYPCNPDGTNLCEKLLPDSVTQEINLERMSPKSDWWFQLIYDGKNLSTSKLNGSSTVCDISNAMASLAPPLDGLTVEGSFPSFSLSYITKLELIQDRSLQLREMNSSSAISAPTIKAPRPTGSMLCGPTSESMIIQGLINYYPCEISSSADPLFQAVFNFPTSTRPHFPVIKTIDIIADVQQTDPLKGGGEKAALKRVINSFVGGEFTSWSPADATYNGMPNTFDLTSVLYMNMRQGYLNVFNLGRYVQHEKSMGDETLVSFERSGGHIMAAVGYEATPHSTYQLSLPPSTSSSPSPTPIVPYYGPITNSADCPNPTPTQDVPVSQVALPQQAASGAPFSIIVNDPFVRNAPPIKPGILKGGKYHTDTIVDIHLPHGASTFIDVLADSWEKNGHHFEFLEDVNSIGIPVLGRQPIIPPSDPRISEAAENLPIDIGATRTAENSLQVLESSIDTAQGSLNLDARFLQSLSAIGASSANWGARLRRLYVAPRVAAAGTNIDLGTLTAHYAAMASADPTGFVTALKAAYDQLDMEPKSVDDGTLRWTWMHPRHDLRALLLEFAARVGATSPSIQATALELAKNEVMRTPNVPIIDLKNAHSEEEQDIAKSLIGALLTPEVAYRLLIANMTESQAIPFTVTVMQHQPHYVVRSAIRSQFRQHFPGSVLTLVNKLEAVGQSADTGPSAQ